MTQLPLFCAGFKHCLRRNTVKLRPDQLDSHLQRQLLPIYLVFGDEPLLAMEASVVIRNAVKSQDGYDERELLTVETGFDWSRLAQAADAGSLFAARRLLELRMENAKPGDAGSKALVAYAQKPNPDAILLISCGKLDQAAQRTRWFKAIDAAGATVQVWPLSGQRLVAWIEARLRAKGLQPDTGAAALLASRAEGNLLAASQEIEKLALLFNPGLISQAQLLEVIGDNARYSIYDLADAALAGRSKRVVRIVNTLRGEGVEPVLAAWALHREVELLCQLRFDLDHGMTLGAALNQQKVWDKRKPLLSAAVQRLDSARCSDLLHGCALLDRIIKGAAPGKPWDALLALSLLLSGQAGTNRALLAEKVA